MSKKVIIPVTPARSWVEFQAVILAGGVGNRLYPLTPATAKPLLPVANRPLLSYQLDLLEKSGFAEALVITETTMAPQVNDFCERYKGHIKIVVVTIEKENCMGTADALRQVKDHIQSDFFVLSGDLITNVFLHHMADVHRDQGAAVTMLLQEEKEEKDQKKRRKQDMAVTNYIGLDHTQQNRVVFFKAAMDVEGKNFSISKSTLRRHPNVTIYTRHLDMHCYLFSRWVLELLTEKPNICSIQGELIPFLTRYQFSSLSHKWRDTQSSTLALDMSHSNRATNLIQAEQTSPVRCYGFVAPDTTYCKRVNTIPNFTQANHHVAQGVFSMEAFLRLPWSRAQGPGADRNGLEAARKRNPDAQFGRNCSFGSSVSVDAKSSVKRTVVGAHCKLGKSVRLTNCVLFDHVVIEDGSQLTDCVVAASAKVSTNCVLRKCMVSPNYTVAPESNFSDEHLC